MSTRPPHRTTRIATALALLTALALVAGCGSQSRNDAAVRKDGSVDLSKVTLVVGDQKGGAQSLLRASGELKDVPYRISWKQFTSGPPLLEALDAGAIDAGGVGNTPPLFAAAAKAEFKVVQAASYGGKGDALLVPRGSTARSVADLRGKRIGVAKGSSANYALLAQLKSAGLDFSDVTVDYLQPADALAAMSAGHLDAWATWEPFTSQAEKDQGARVVADGSNGVTNGYTFQVASDQALDDKATAAALRDYLARITRSETWGATHKAAWAKVWAKETGLSTTITSAALAKRDVEVVPVDQQVVDSEQKMADAFAEAKLVPGRLDVSSYFTDRYDAASAR